MAQSSKSRPVGPNTAPPGGSAVSTAEINTTQAALEFSLKELAATLSAHSEQALATDLALDLILNGIVEQAKLATNASAAAIALATGEEIVCRATTGVNAPDLGVRLDAQRGLSGACVRTRIWQRCDDSETDTRVNAEACRYLGVRSILVYPLLSGADLLGVMEIFSSKASAFSDREIHTLEALSRSVVESVHHAGGVLSSGPEDESILSDLSHSDLMAVLAAQPAGVALRLDRTYPDADVPSVLAGGVPTPGKVLSTAGISAATPTVEPRADRWSTVLTVLVIALAVTLGWLVGHVGRSQRVALGAEGKGISNTTPPTPAVEQKLASDNAKSARQEPAQPPANSTPKPTKTDIAPGSGLVVYDKGKVIYRTNTAESSDASSNGISSASIRTKDSGTDSPANLSPETASQYLIGRVEPDYPQQAREQHLQGAVVLQVLVAENGSIESVSTLSGDPVLASPATEAVRHWEFRPFVSHGHPQAFQTQVTVNFRMP